MRKLIIVLLICLFGFSSRFFVFQSQHPDTDELFELRHMQQLGWSDVFKRDTFYGDHTSFPGEFIVHYIPMRIINCFNENIDLSYEDGTIGLTNKQRWILASPKIIMSILSFFLFWRICQTFLMTHVAFMVAFLMIAMNPTLIYHSFSLRPYGILPELAILNMFLATRNFSIVHGIVIFFTCIYHAYGPLIALLPLVGFRIKAYCVMHDTKEYEKMALFVFPALIAWAYYASYNTFGMVPNKSQSIVDTFQFITKENFINGIIDSMFAGSMLTMVCLVFVVLGVMSCDRKDVLFVSSMVVLPILLICLVDIKTQYWIHPRQYCWVIPALALWCGMMAER